MSPPAVDPITRSVVQHRLSSIVTEMGEAMLRTSYSQILNSSRDFSLALCDVNARLIAQADHIPVHVGALPWATRAVERTPHRSSRANFWPRTSRATRLRPAPSRRRALKPIPH